MKARIFLCIAAMFLCGTACVADSGVGLFLPPSWERVLAPPSANTPGAPVIVDAAESAAMRTTALVMDVGKVALPARMQTLDGYATALADARGGKCRRVPGTSILVQLEFDAVRLFCGPGGMIYVIDTGFDFVVLETTFDRDDGHHWLPLHMLRFPEFGGRSIAEMFPWYSTRKMVSVSVFDRHVRDGDTFEAVVCCLPGEGAKRVVIRVPYVDAPEMGQPGAPYAAEMLSRALSHGECVASPRGGHDRYGRYVWPVICDGLPVHHMLLSNGAAWVAPGYRPETTDELEKMRAAERDAREKKIGIWAIDRPEPPWDYRKRTRKSL